MRCDAGEVLLTPCPSQRAAENIWQRPSPLSALLPACSTHVGASAAHPELCERCLPVIEQMGFQPPPAAAPEQEAAVSA